MPRTRVDPKQKTRQARSKTNQFIESEINAKKARQLKINLTRTSLKKPVRGNQSRSKYARELQIYKLRSVSTPLGLKRKAHYGTVVKWEKLLTRLEQQKNNPNIVIPWYIDDKIMPFYMLHLLKENNSNCYKKTNMGTIYFDVETMNIVSGFGTYQEEIVAIREAYHQCSKNILVIPVGLLNIPSGYGTHLAHANMLFLNKKRKEFEHYEPHGSSFSENNPFIKQFSENLKQLNNDLGLGLSYIATDETCPIGFQVYESQAQKVEFNHRGFDITTEAGYCGAWSFFYANMRMKYPGKPRDIIMNDLFRKIGKDPEELRNFIRGQSLTLSKELIKMDKKYPFGDYLFAAKTVDSDLGAQRLVKEKWFQEASASYNDYIQMEFTKL